MSRVFLATENALRRRVVIKVLSPELAVGVSGRRFEREIQTAASLQQANIVPVLSAGSVGDLPIYVMPFVEGLSLRERLVRDGRPPLAETVNILRDIARALAYAHERGVVHRDIKPENVLLSGDAAVVTDFGIAKAVQTARATTAGESGTGSTMPALTTEGISLGTPAYMAPEQVTADPGIDHRADLYAFGCVAYELLTGAAPFAGRPAHAQLGAHLAEVPVPVGERSPGTPPSIARMVTGCLEKDPEHRPQSAREVLSALEGATAATGLVRLQQQLSRRQRRLAVATVASFAFLAVILVGRRWVGGPSVVSVSVIPFLNPAADSADEYLAAGLSDGLATSLGKVAGVRVVSRSLSQRYRGMQQLDPREVGRELSADQVLQGSVRRAAGRLHVSAQLTSTRDNSEIWSETYDRSASDAPAVQREITLAIVRALRERLGVAGDASDDAESGTTNAEAYDLHLRGNFLLQRRGAGVRQAVANFERAIELDTNFAAARASLALALELMPYFENVSETAVRPAAVAQANRALARDSTLADAHTALAMAHQHGYEWRAADERYRRTMALNPDEADAHIQYGRFLFYTGRLTEALARFERARALAPHSSVASGWVGHLLDLSGRPEDALAEVTRALEIDSTSPPVLVFAAQVHLTSGNRDASLRYADRLWRTVPQWRVAAAMLLADLGDTTRARILLADESGPVPAQPNTPMALLHLASGDTSQYFEALERATASGEMWPTFFSLSERTFDRVRSSARFAAIVRSVGLDEATFTSPTGGRPQ
jgi:serine/threonine-protein kinase